MSLRLAPNVGGRPASLQQRSGSSLVPASRALLPERKSWCGTSRSGWSAGSRQREHARRHWLAISLHASANDSSGPTGSPAPEDSPPATPSTSSPFQEPIQESGAPEPKGSPRWYRIVVAAASKVRRNLLALLLTHALADAAIFLLHRASHRLTNEGMVDGVDEDCCSVAMRDCTGMPYPGQLSHTRSAAAHDGAFSTECPRHTTRLRSSSPSQWHSASSLDCLCLQY